MNQTISFDGSLFDIESGELQEALKTTLELRANRPRCMCCAREPLMYVSKLRSAYVIKRMPGTGHLHDPSCESYEAPAMISGLVDLQGKAISHDAETDVTTLKLGFALSRKVQGLGVYPVVSTSETAKLSPAKISLLSTLHFFWTDAGFNRWSPWMAGKRNYGVVYKYLMESVIACHAKRMPFSELIYIPEPFFAASAPAIKNRFAHRLSRCAYKTKGDQDLLLVLCEVKSIYDLTGRFVLTPKHAPFLELHIAKPLMDKVASLFAAELALWNAEMGCRLILMGTVSQNAALIYELSEIALMAVDEAWIPVKSLPEVALYARLGASKRYFLRGLPFNRNAGQVQANALLTDTMRPTAIYLVTGTEEATELEGLIEECLESELDCVFVNQLGIETGELPMIKMVAK